MDGPIDSRLGTALYDDLEGLPEGAGPADAAPGRTRSDARRDIRFGLVYRCSLSRRATNTHDWT